MAGLLDPSVTSQPRLPSLQISSPRMELPIDPQVAHGTLPCGLTYYVKANGKPARRVALQLAVRTGSVNEEDHERGMAHMIEHLGFRATRNYPNFALVKFLESIGASFGACQNAYTSFDETVYMLTVPIDTPALLREAVRILHEWASRIRLSEEDVEGERRVVLEELREGRTSRGRMAEAYWEEFAKGSKYAERMPIGTEAGILQASSRGLKAFYRKWYSLAQMAAVVVGDFDDVQAVCEMLREEFSSEPCLPEAQRAALLSPPRPLTIPSHTEPRVVCLEDPEATGCEVSLECKQPRAVQTSTAATLLRYIRINLCADAINQRLHAISKREGAPMFAAAAGNRLPCRAVESYTVTASTAPGQQLRALKVLLLELERIKAHGFSELELGLVKANYLSELKTAYVERLQFDSSQLARECTSHFLSGELLLGIDIEVAASRALLESVSAEALREEVSNWALRSSCVVKLVAPNHRFGSSGPKPPTAHEVREIIREVMGQSYSELTAWASQTTRKSLEELLPRQPSPGAVISSRQWRGSFVEEWQLSNGMTVFVRPTQLQNDELLIHGMAYGGLSELPLRSYLTAALSDWIATESGAFGCGPVELVELLAGKNVNVRFR